MFKYYKCPSCQLVSTYPIPDKSQIKSHYKENFSKGNYKFLRDFAKQYHKIYKGFLKEIREYYLSENKKIDSVNLLDIGCFTGEFIFLASKENIDVYGIELQKDAVKIANKKLPGKVIARDIEHNPFKKRFDIITMFGLIEHVEKPDKLIKNVSKLLKADGIIVIQTPNNGSIFEKILRKYWPPYSPIEHIHLFNKISITKLLSQNGLKIIKFKNHFKILPISYVYNMLNVFSPEFKKQIDKLPLVNFNKSNSSFPFYIGEMFIIAKKK